VTEAQPAASRRRPRLAPAVASVVLALGTGVALLHLRSAWNLAHPLVRSRAVRLAGPLRSIDLDPRLYRAAERVIPRDGTYTIVTGPHVHVSTSATLHGVLSQAPFWLLPRRHVDERSADWVISFGGDLGSHARYARIVHVARGMDIAQVKR
jgi:hypothetical protein